MLKGKAITLRPATEDDISRLYEVRMDLDNRDPQFPLHIRTRTEIRKDIAENGLWKDDLGVLVVVDIASQRVIGEIIWFKTVPYLDEIELGYWTYDGAQRSKGVATEALRLLTAYLFDTKPINRIRLCIATENFPSIRVAEKSGFTHEGTQRAAVKGRDARHLDMQLFSMLRLDSRPA